jgi:PBP1b-binding outer membrane lipoprotein LpoB
MRLSLLVFSAILLTSCGAVEPNQVADAPAAQNLQEKQTDFTATGASGGNALEAQRDIPGLLNQIHTEAEHAAH